MKNIIVLFLSLLTYTQAHAGSAIRKYIKSDGTVLFTNIPNHALAKSRSLSEPITTTNPVSLSQPSVSNNTVVESTPKKVSTKGNVKFTYFYKGCEGGHLYTDRPRLDCQLVSQRMAIVSKPATTLAGFMKPRFSSIAHNKSQFKELIEDAAMRHQVDSKLLHAVIQTESAYNASAISSAGAVGLMQLMPATARRFGVSDRTDPIQNIEGGTRYLRHLLNLFPNDLDLAVAAYNAGENAVMRHNNTIPPYPETVNYVKQVLALYKQ